ncbi:BatD family protein [Haliangium sp.]|uniref:BatD family protein n=1 Tax=Haliangium sp. TaxID=2663208 RepID=UPI003D143837
MSARRRNAVVMALALAAAAGVPGTALAQRQRQAQPRVTLHLEGQGRDVHAGLPFVLAVSAEGFEPEPEPEIGELAIPGCRVTALGVSPNVSTSISIVNGRRSELRRVEFVYRFRVEAEASGTYQVPALTVTQGELRASSKPARFEAVEVPTTEAMKLSLGLPERPVWVGETFDVELDWLLLRDPGEPRFSIPLLDDPARFEVHVPSVDDARQRRRTLSVTVGDRDIDLPYTQDTVRQGGEQFTRVRMRLSVTPLQAGTFTAAPAQVAAPLQIGVGRDAFGFRTARTKLFKAEDMLRTVEIRPLPLADRPPSFAGAVGKGFSIKVQASRTVVRVGEPIALEILLRGDGRMEGLGLPPLVNPQGLPEEHFSVSSGSDGSIAGEVLDGGMGKRFVVTVRLEDAEVREIPPIGFSYFNPETAAYETAFSEPIALQVAGSSVVGAAEVVSAVVADTEHGADMGQGERADGAGAGSFVGAELGLSHPEETLDGAWTERAARPLLYGLYLVALALFVGRLVQVRTRARRGRSSRLGEARRTLRQALAQAASEPARDAAPALLAALRALARATEQRARSHVITNIETEAYSPAAATEPLSAALREQVEDQAEAWVRAARDGAGEAEVDERPSSSRTGALLALLAGAAVLGQAGAASAEVGTASLDQARQVYQEALAATDRDQRTRGFARAEGLFRELVSAYPDRPELLADWGNAALGAQDLGRATLAYRRALALDPGLDRADRNLSWVRERAPSWLPRPHSRGAVSSLLFWNRILSVPARHVVAAVAFAIAVVLVAPWGRGRRVRIPLVIVTAAVWLLMLLSIQQQRDAAADAVVMRDDVSLRAADSPGAPPALPSPLPAGAEVEVVEVRAPWARVRLADGTSGWVERSAIELVSPPG